MLLKINVVRVKNLEGMWKSNVLFQSFLVEKPARKRISTLGPVDLCWLVFNQKTCIFECLLIKLAFVSHNGL